MDQLTNAFVSINAREFNGAIMLPARVLDIVLVNSMRAVTIRQTIIHKNHLMLMASVQPCEQV